MLGGQLRKHFAVEVNIFLFQLTNELGVAQAVRPDRGINPNLPEGAVGALLFFASPIGVDASFQDGSSSELNGIFSAPTKAFGLLE